MTVYEADNLDISDAELKVNLEAAQGKTTWRKKPIVIAHAETLHLSISRSKKKLNYLLRNTSLRQESTIFIFYVIFEFASAQCEQRTPRQLRRRSFSIQKYFTVYRHSLLIADFYFRQTQPERCY